MADDRGQMAENRVKMAERIPSYRDLKAYQTARSLAQQLFVESKAWPKEEIYSLTSQIRRSSRAVGAALAEAWAKRTYPAHFLSKLTDADAELQETCHWVETANECGYLPIAKQKELLRTAEEIGKMVGMMMRKHKSFCRAAEKKASNR